MPTDPYAVLEIAPTREVSLIKRAYFAALTRHSPQTDPDGFRQVRDAYELLSNPATRAAAFSASPLDVALLARDYGLRFDARIDEHARLATAQQSTGAAEQQFIAQYSFQSWAELLATLHAIG